MTLTRRGFLRGVGPVTLAPFLPACAGADETRVNAAEGWGVPSVAPQALEPLLDGTEAWPPPGADSPFKHGVASGDPLTDAVVLWTRVTPRDAVATRVEVEWRLALDPALTQVIRAGLASTDPSIDFTLHVDVDGLRSNATYYYQFRALGEASPAGRTKTLPLGTVERMRLAVTSCANYPAGFFNVYALLAQADVDLVLHLGDYLYEYANLTFGDGEPIGRLPDPPQEIVSLEDYRRRHAQYKTDPDLQELHRQHPWVTVWDDHELANDAFATGAQNHQAASEGDFELRKASAIKAYREWMPIRSVGEPSRIYRSFSCGDLIDLVMLDTRLAGREQPAADCAADVLNAAGRQLLGAAQEAWLMAELADSKARGTRWRFVGQQVIFAPLLRSARGCVWSPDNWDGYSAGRGRVLDALGAGNIDNVVVLTGDAHASWAIDVAPDPFDTAAYDPGSGRGSKLVEFVTPAVSSAGSGASVAAILQTHPHVKFANQTRQGYILLDVTHEWTQAEWYFVSTVRERSLESELGGVYRTRAGQPHVVPVDEPSEPRRNAPALAI